MKPNPSTMFTALWSIGPVARSLNSGNSTAPTTIIPATRHAARNPNRITNSRPINAKVQIHSLSVADTQLPHPEGRPIGRVSKDGGILMVRDGAPDSASALPGERLLTMRTVSDTNGTYQSVIAMARSACRSRTDSFSVSDLSWPQAARISRPRGVRTGEEYPALKIYSENFSI